MKRLSIFLTGCFALVTAALAAQGDKTSDDSGGLGSQAHFDELLKKAQDGGMEEAFEIGIAYLEAESEKRNPSEAWRWIGQAARLGHAEAQCLMGLQSQHGIKGENGNADAIKWLTLAAEKEHLESLLLLGYKYSEGKIVPKDEIKALSFYKRAVKRGGVPNFRLYTANIDLTFAKMFLTGSLREAAEKGDLESQVLLGAEHNRELLRIHLEESTSWLLKAAKRGDVESQYRACLAYLAGRGVRQDYTEAANWCRKAVGKPNSEIAATWACMLMRGIGVGVNIPESAKWFLKSMELGGPGVNVSCHKFQQFFIKMPLYGEGKPEMVALYLKAYVDNDAESQFQYAELHRQGGLLNGDEAEVFKWWKRAAENGHVEAQFKVGDSYQNGRFSDVNNAEAVKWYRMAAEQGHQDAQYNLAIMYSYADEVKKDESGAVRLLLQAAEQGHVKASAAMGIRYLEGKGVDKNYTKAFNWLSKAALKDDTEGQFFIGFMFHDGLGCTPDYVEAAKWFSLAADAGHQGGQFYLGTLYARGDGVPKSDLLAYKWLLLAKANGVKIVDKQINGVELKLTPEQRLEGQKMANEFVSLRERKAKMSIQRIRGRDK